MFSIIIVSCEKNQNTVTPQEQDAALKAGGGNGCTTIQSGDLVNSAGETIETGYDDFGYNYQAHIYNGDYGDGLLDRHYGFDSYIGSGAWFTNHQSGTYEDENGNTCHWTYFVKIIAAPADAYKDDGVWHAADGTEIGPVIWGSFAIIQEV